MTKFKTVYYPDYPSPVKSQEGTLVVRRADKSDLVSFGGNSARHRCIAWCGDLEGEIIGVGGFFLDENRWIGFVELGEKGFEYKIALIKTANMVMEYMKKTDHKRLYAIVDNSFPNAGRWVEKLGFEYRPPRIWVWRAQE